MVLFIYIGDPRANWSTKHLIGFQYQYFHDRGYSKSIHLFTLLFILFNKYAFQNEMHYPNYLLVNIGHLILI